MAASVLDTLSFEVVGGKSSRGPIMVAWLFDGMPASEAVDELKGQLASELGVSQDALSVLDINKVGISLSGLVHTIQNGKLDRLKGLEAGLLKLHVQIKKVSGNNHPVVLAAHAKLLLM